MLRLKCAMELLNIYHRYDYPNSEETKAIAYAIMQLGRRELKEKLKASVGETKGEEVHYEMANTTGAPVRQWVQEVE